MWILFALKVFLWMIVIYLAAIGLLFVISRIGGNR